MSDLVTPTGGTLDPALSSVQVTPSAPAGWYYDPDGNLLPSNPQTTIPVNTTPAAPYTPAVSLVPNVPAGYYMDPDGNVLPIVNPQTGIASTLSTIGGLYPSGAVFLPDTPPAPASVTTILATNPPGSSATLPSAPVISDYMNTLLDNFFATNTPTINLPTIMGVAQSTAPVTTVPVATAAPVATPVAQTAAQRIAALHAAQLLSDPGPGGVTLPAPVTTTVPQLIAQLNTVTPDGQLVTTPVTGFGNIVDPTLAQLKRLQFAV